MDNCSNPILNFLSPNSKLETNGFYGVSSASGQNEGCEGIHVGLGLELKVLISKFPLLSVSTGASRARI